MESAHSYELFKTDSLIYSSNYGKSTMELTTADEARAPTVKCGYLYLNQADKPPGYDPPIVIHGISLVTPCN